MKTKIDSKNLVPHIGKLTNLYCQVGVLFSIQGTLERATLTSYQLRLPNGETIGFSYGEFTVLSKGLSITIN